MNDLKFTTAGDYMNTNERIQELALECYNPYSNFDHSKFAKLIVLKCAEIADTAEPFLASDLIKEHFGIKE
jgi:hypothetical protein